MEDTVHTTASSAHLDLSSFGTGAGGTSGFDAEAFGQGGADADAFTQGDGRDQGPDRFIVPTAAAVLVGEGPSSDSPLFGDGAFDSEDPFGDGLDAPMAVEVW